jgi:glycine cleavage system regulatory protein
VGFTSNGLEIIKSRISTFSDRFDILMKIRLSGVATLAGKIKEKCQA